MMLHHKCLMQHHICITASPAPDSNQYLLTMDSDPSPVFPEVAIFYLSESLR